MTLTWNNPWKLICHYTKKPKPKKETRHVCFWIEVSEEFVEALRSLLTCLSPFNRKKYCLSLTINVRIQCRWFQKPLIEKMTAANVVQCKRRFGIWAKTLPNDDSHNSEDNIYPSHLPMWFYIFIFIHFRAIFIVFSLYSFLFFVNILNFSTFHATRDLLL